MNKIVVYMSSCTNCVFSFPYRQKRLWGDPSIYTNLQFIQILQTTFFLPVAYLQKMTLVFGSESPYFYWIWNVNIYRRMTL